MKYAEMEFFQNVLVQLSNIQKYIGHLKKSLQEQQDHILRCVLYNAVHMCQPIHAIRIEGSRVIFRDVHIIDSIGKTTAFSIKKKLDSLGYRVLSGCTNDDGTPLLIETDAPMTFRYITLKHLDCCCNCRVILIMKNNEEMVYISKKKHMICNRAF